MIRAEFTRDHDLILSQISSNWDDICEDGVERQSYSVPDYGIYVSLYDGPALIGIQLYYQVSAVSLEFHTIVSHGYRGTIKALRAQKKGWGLVFSETDCEKINSTIPVYRKDVIRYAKGLGMLFEGTDIASWKKFDQVWGQVRFGITKQMFLGRIL